MNLHDQIIQNVQALATGAAAAGAFADRPYAGLLMDPPFAASNAFAAASNGVSLDEHSRAVAAARAEAERAAIAAQRLRIAGILDHPNAKGREAVARQLAFKSEMSVEEAGAFLGDCPSLSRPSGAGAIDTAAIYAARAGRAPLDTTDIYASRAAAAAGGLPMPPAHPGSDAESADVYARRAAQAKSSSRS